jgi:hypothetical protein
LKIKINGITKSGQPADKLKMQSILHFATKLTSNGCLKKSPTGSGGKKNVNNSFVT